MSNDGLVIAVGISRPHSEQADKIVQDFVHLMLDLEIDDVEAEVRRLEALGAMPYDPSKKAATTSGCSATPGPTSSP